jgi:methyl-accepting chemotaxis protein
VAAFILSIVIGLFLARSIGRPVRALADVAGRISEGDLRGEIAVESRTDEIGTLGEAFQRMVTSMRNQTAKVDDIVEELSEVASSLSTTMSQQVQLSTNTSSAVSEVTATVTQVRRSAQITNDKAKNVANISQDALRISDSAKNSTQMTADKMNLIRKQMQSIGETVVKLSDQSQAIDNIVVSVQDLTDQSNLLAVNASIEAARAGKHGKGFAVVSHEIKTLADESKNATVQIRTILDDISKWVSAVVMATEQGSKAVDLGVEQSSLAGESIKSLVDGVADSAQAASAISAASQDQLAGMDQATDAMEVIETTMQQNLDTTSQLESAARKLQGLGETLTELVKYYKV